MTDAELDAARAKLASGDWQYSIRDPNYIVLLRTLAADGLSGSQIATEVSVPGRPVSRSAVLSICNRVRPRIELKRRPGDHTGVPHPKRGPRRQRGSPDTLSTHYVRLQRAVAAKHARQVDRDPLSKIFKSPPVFASQTEANARPRLRHFQAHCNWFGCPNEPMAPGKPYCTTHHAASGNMFR